MNGDRLFNVIGMVLTIALVTTVVGHPRTAEVVRSIGVQGRGLLETAMGVAAGGKR